MTWQNCGREPFSFETNKMKLSKTVHFPNVARDQIFLALLALGRKGLTTPGVKPQSQILFQFLLCLCKKNFCRIIYKTADFIRWFESTSKPELTTSSELRPPAYSDLHGVQI
jgi:hypothetical protein